MPIATRTLFVLPAVALVSSLLLGGSSASPAQSAEVSLHANSQTRAADIGLPAYPGATLFKDPDDDSAADLGLSFGDFHFTLKVVSYSTPDSVEKVLQFYRKPLSRYGDVLECDRGKPMGTISVARSGLTCSDDDGDHVRVNNTSDSSTDHELRAGVPKKYRIVGLEKRPDGATKFSLVYMELPRDSDEK